ncbi:MAG TPA: hypothetical protein VJ746_18080 [Nitrospira sp.]|nr:hypothetical protein [Nitrospira sp.]
MMHTEPYLFLLGLCPIVALPLVIGVRTLLALEERIIVPILRMKTESGSLQAITYKRNRHRPAILAKPRPYVIAAPAKFTQSRRIS